MILVLRIVMTSKVKSKDRTGTVTVDDWTCVLEAVDQNCHGATDSSYFFLFGFHRHQHTKELTMPS